MKTLVTLTPHPQHENEMLWLDETGYQAFTDTALTERLREQANDSVIRLLIPGHLCLCLSTSLPNMPLPKLKQALPFALEEQLATPLETVHLTYCGQSQEKHWAIGISKEALKQYQTLPIQQAMPDYWMIPVDASCWQIYVDNAFCYARLSEHQGFCLPSELLPAMLTLLWNESPCPKPNQVELTLLGTDISLNRDELTTLAMPLHIHPTQKTWLEILSAFIQNASHTSQPSINLLHGDFAPATARKPLKKRALLLGTFALLWLISWLGGNYLEQQRLNQQISDVDSAINALYYQVFPEASSVIAPELRFQQQLEQQQQANAGNQFLTLLALLSEGLKNHKNIHLERLQFDNQRLTISMTLPSFSELENLIAELKQLPIDVSQQHASEKKQSIHAELLLSRKQ